MQIQSIDPFDTVYFIVAQVKQTQTHTFTDSFYSLDLIIVHSKLLEINKATEVWNNFEFVVTQI